MATFRPLFAKPNDAETKKYLACLEKAYLTRKPQYQKESHFHGLINSKDADDRALSAGVTIRRAIDADEYSHSKTDPSNELNIIYDWKNGGSRFWKRLVRDFNDRNPPARMREALHRANKATKDHDNSLAMLCLLTPSLIGVRVKSASAILACIYPEQYTVVDELAARHSIIGTSKPQILRFTVTI